MPDSPVQVLLGSHNNSSAVLGSLVILEVRPLLLLHSRKPWLPRGKLSEAQEMFDGGWLTHTGNLPGRVPLWPRCVGTWEGDSGDLTVF